MKIVAVSFILLMTIQSSFANFYNINTGNFRTRLPNPLGRVFNPTQQMYREAGWYPAQPAQSYQWREKSSVWELVGDTAIENATYTDVIVEKPEMVLLAEQQYLHIWHHIMGEENTDYLYIDRETVLKQISLVALEDSSVYALMFAFERSFDIFADWWIGLTGGEFHPYPWEQIEINMWEFFQR